MTRFSMIVDFSTNLFSRLSSAIVSQRKSSRRRRRSLLQMHPDTESLEERLFLSGTGASNFAVEFGGTDYGFIELSDSTNASLTNDFTVSLWFETAGHRDTRLFAKGDGSAVAFTLGVDAHDRIHVTASSDGGSGRGRGTDLFKSSVKVPLNQFNHIAMTWKNGLAIYLNGEKIQMKAQRYGRTPTGALFGGAPLVRVAGDSFTKLTRAFRGAIDEMSWWKGARDINWVRDLYNGGTATDLRSHADNDDLLMWHRMGDNDTLPIVSDHAGDDDALRLYGNSSITKSDLKYVMSENAPVVGSTNADGSVLTTVQQENLAVEFDGNDYGFVNLSPSTNAALRNDFTVSLWFETAGHRDTRLFAKGDGSAVAFSLGVDAQDRIHVTASSDGAYGRRRGTDLFKSSVKVPLNQFNHIAMTWKNGLAIYLNGERIQMKAQRYGRTPTGALFGGAPLVRVAGDSFTKLTRAFRGAIDEMSWWKGARDINWVRDLYNGGKATDLRSHADNDDLLMWHRMGDNDTLPRVADQAGGDDQLTLYADPQFVSSELPFESALPQQSELTSSDSVAVSPDLVAHYPLTASGEDTVGALDSIRSRVDSFTGEGAIFARRGDFIEIPSSPILEQKQFTISAQVRPDSAGPNNDQYGSVIVQKGRALGIWWTEKDGGRFVFRLNGKGLQQSKDSFPVGHDYEVRLSFDGTTARLFVNDQLQSDFRYAGGIKYSLDADLPWTLGSTAEKWRVSHWPRTFIGELSNVRFYDTAEPTVVEPAVPDAGAQTETEPSVTVMVSPDLVAHYPLTASGEDTVGALDSIRSRVDSFTGEGAIFARRGDFIEIPSSPILEQKEFTISAQVRPDSAGPNNDQYGSVIIQKGRALGIWWTEQDGGRFVFRLNGNGLQQSKDRFPAGRDYEVRLSFDGTTARLLVNDELQSNYRYAGGIQYSMDADLPWTLGSTAEKWRVSHWPRTFIGELSNVRFYDTAEPTVVEPAVPDAGAQSQTEPAQHVDELLSVVEAMDGFRPKLAATPPPKQSQSPDDVDDDSTITIRPHQLNIEDLAALEEEAVIIGRSHLSADEFIDADRNVYVNFYVEEAGLLTLNVEHLGPQPEGNNVPSLVVKLRDEEMTRERLEANLEPLGKTLAQVGRDAEPDPIPHGKRRSKFNKGSVLVRVEANTYYSLEFDYYFPETEESREEDVFKLKLSHTHKDSKKGQPKQSELELPLSRIRVTKPLTNSNIKVLAIESAKPAILKRIDNKSIWDLDNIETWIIAHGKKQNFDVDEAGEFDDVILGELVASVQSQKPNAQILTYDWSDAADSVFNSGARWIRTAGGALANGLDVLGIKPRNVNAIGFSWGAHVVAQAAEVLATRPTEKHVPINFLLALDAANLVEWEGFEPVDFGAASRRSVSIGGGGWAEHQKIPTTATSTIRMVFPSTASVFEEHIGVLQGFNNMQSRSDQISEKFQLDSLMSDPVWLYDGFNSGSIENYEAVLVMDGDTGGLLHDWFTFKNLEVQSLQYREARGMVRLDVEGGQIVDAPAIKLKKNRKLVKRGAIQVPVLNAQGLKHSNWIGAGSSEDIYAFRLERSSRVSFTLDELNRDTFPAEVALHTLTSNPKKPKAFVKFLSSETGSVDVFDVWLSSDEIYFLQIRKHKSLGVARNLGEADAPYTLKISTVPVTSARTDAALHFVSQISDREIDSREEIDLSEVLPDNIGHEAHWSVATDSEAITSVSVSGTTLQLTPKAEGVASITVTVAVGSNTISQSFFVTTDASSIRASVSELARQAEFLQRRVGEARRLIESANLETTRVNQAGSEIKARVSAKSKELAGLRSQLDSAQAKVAAGQSNFDRLNVANNRAKAALQSAEARLQAAKRAYQNLDSQTRGLFNKKRGLERQIASLTSRIQRTGNRRVQNLLKLQRKVKKAELTQVTSQWRNSQNQRSTALRQKNQAANSRYQAQSQVSRLSGQTNAARGKLASAARLRDGIAGKVQKKEASLIAEQSALAGLRDQVKAVNDKLVKAAQIIAEVITERTRLTSELTAIRVSKWAGNLGLKQAESDLATLSDRVTATDADRAAASDRATRVAQKLSDVGL